MEESNKEHKMAHYSINTLTEAQKALLGVDGIAQLKKIAEALSAIPDSEKLVSDAIGNAIKSAEADLRKAKRVADSREKNFKNNLIFSVAGIDDTDDEEYKLKGITIIHSKKNGDLVKVTGGHDSNAVGVVRKVEASSGKDYEVILDTKQKRNSKNYLLVKGNSNVVLGWFKEAVLDRFESFDNLISWLKSLQKANGEKKINVIDLDSLVALGKGGDKSAEKKSRALSDLYHIKGIKC